VAIRQVGGQVSAPGGVGQKVPLLPLGDTLVSADHDPIDLEARLRRADADLERRIHAGDQECFVEEYFKTWPELAASVDTAIDLIYTEFDARAQAGRPLPPENYYERFPQWRNELERQFAIHKIDEPDTTRMIRILGPDGRREQYRVLKEISQGPNGNLVKARHVRLNRLVAIKTFAGGDQAEAERFQFGAREQQRLRHASILPVYDVGESEDGLPCFVMEFAEGGSLDQRIAGKPLPPREAAQLVRALAEAMSHAHAAGVVHRDLKPANVVLTAEDLPLITDFGLARRVDASNDQSKTGEILGTVPYMAPEQAAGRTHEVGPLCDVYALGAILYESLTGQPPFKGRTVVEGLQQILKQSPVRPRRVVRGVPPGLESICLKCLEKKPRRRYGSAQELADDLGRWLDGKRPEAHSRWARASRFVRKHPVLYPAAVVLVVVASLTLGAYLLDPERRIESIERDLARGKEAILIGEKGLPRWDRWATSEETQQAQLAEDGTFHLVCDRMALKELVRDPQHSQYRFRAQVRHDTAFAKTAEVGIYFAYTIQGPNGVVHYFCAVAFHGVKGLRQQYRRGEPVNLKVWGQGHGGSTFRSCTSGKPIYLPGAQQDQGNDWFNLVVDVSPQTIRFAAWKNGESEGHSKEVAIGTVEDSMKVVSASLLPGTPESDRALALRGSLGLLVSRASASFKQVVLIPKP
jgi:hypothetical protein